MSKQTLKPVPSNEECIGGELKTRYDHPAFGKVVLSHPQGNFTLFGSDVAHHGSMCISLYRAHLDRHLNHDYIGQDELVAQFELSAAQFAQFITSQGSGAGTPCTLTYGPEDGVKVISYPAIEKIESKMDLHRKEIAEHSKQQMDRVKKSLEAVNALMDSPTVPKKAMKEALFHLRAMVDNVTPNMEHSIKSAEKALDKAVIDAKIEVESFVTLMTHRIGVSSLEKLGQIASKVEQGSIPLE